MRVRVDADVCTGHGRCYLVASDMYGADDEGYNDARGRTVDVRPGREASARLGAQSCPEGAITIVEG